MAIIRALSAGPHASVPGESTSQAKLEEVMSTSSSTTETETSNLASALKNKAKTTKGLSPTQKAAYDKKMLAAVQGNKPRGLSGDDKLTVAAVVTGALGALQPSGPDLAKPETQDTQMATVDLQTSMQKQQQAFQLLSNIQKAQHDTAKAIIHNLR